uniref:Uncharacterized protein n=1 Tax=Oryza brachyantha TaxID=4533 RepID=J3MAA1_ORYBR
MLMCLTSPSRRYRHLLYQLFDFWIHGMVFNRVVVAGQNSESLWGAVPHVDVHVHPARPQQCWVKTLSVVCGEDDDPLLAAC